MFFTSGGFGFQDMPDSAMRGPKRDADTTKFYDLLGLTKDATAADIKKAYRKLAIKHHPDKGGDPEMFKEISRAYEVLSEPEKRKLYDEYGEEGLEGPQADPTDIFDLFFGGGRRRPQGKRRGDDIESPLKVTLEQIYNGATRRMAISKDVICDTCDGHGGPASEIQTCKVCHGTGARVTIRQIGPMIQQTQSPCTVCRQGKVIPEDKKCPKCRGVGTCKDKKYLEVYIEPGVPDRHCIVFSGEADERPDMIPGDIKFIVDQQPHPTFQRKGANLVMKKEITLFEALTGFQFVVAHLDNRKLLLRSAPGEVTSPAAVKVVRGEGLPLHKQRFERGHLFIEFDVKMPRPEDLLMHGASLKTALKKVLPQPESLKEKTEGVEEHVVADVRPDDYQSRAGRSEAYEEDSEEPGAPRVQCRQQ